MKADLLRIRADLLRSALLIPSPQPLVPDQISTIPLLSPNLSV